MEAKYSFLYNRVYINQNAFTGLLLNYFSDSSASYDSL